MTNRRIPRFKFQRPNAVSAGRFISLPSIARFVVAVAVATGIQWTAFNTPTATAQAVDAPSERSLPDARDLRDLRARAERGEFQIVRDALATSSLKDHDPQVASLITDLDRYLVGRGQQRKINTAITLAKLQAMNAKLREGRLEDALEDAIEAHEHASDQPALLQREDVTALTQQAEAAARLAKSRGDLLEALNLYHHLELLYEQQPTISYRTQTELVNLRVRMLRLYVPAALDKLYRERAVKLGEGDLAAVPLRENDTWQEQLDGVTRQIMFDAIEDAGEHHIDQKGFGALMTGALESVLLLIDTPQLIDTFPALRRADRVAELRTGMQDMLEEIKQGDDLSRRLAVRLLNRTLTLNAKLDLLPDRVLIYELTEGAMRSLDAFSAVIWPYEVAQFRRNTQGSFFGVGITISHPKRPLVIEAVTPDSAADVAGLLPDDSIIAIAGVDTTTRTIRWAYWELKAPDAESTAITIERQTDEGIEQLELNLPADPGIKLRRPSSILTVVSPMLKTPAHQAGVKPGDTIVSVNGVATDDWSLDHAVREITGPPGTKVALQIKREGQDELLDVELTRGQIDVPSIAGWEHTPDGDWSYLIDPDNRIGYVRLSQFLPQSPADLDHAVNQLQDTGGLNGLILDLRFNPGGLLNKSVDIANRFIRTGKVVSTVDAKGVEKKPLYARPQLAYPDYPLIVLINQGSASASEIVAGALQDYRRATILGNRSYGKGSVQDLFPIGGDAYLKLTTQYYMLPGDRIIHRRPGAATWGIEPDLHVRMTTQEVFDAVELRRELDVILDADSINAPQASTLLNESMDAQLDAALLILKTRLVTDHINLAQIENPTKSVTP